MGGPTQAAGRRGELLAAEYLARRGFVILATNFRHGRKEIDLIARGEGFVVFVEVKLRTSERFGGPAAAVHRLKQSAIVACARGFLHRFGLDDAACRFDVIAIQAAGGDEPRIEHIRNAFSTTA
jgi:putative endonuclease